MHRVQQCFTHFGWFVQLSSQQTEQEYKQNVFGSVSRFSSLGKGKIIVVGDFNFHIEDEHDSKVYT